MNRQEHRHATPQSNSVKKWFWIAAVVLVIAGIWYFSYNRGTGVDYSQYQYSDDKYAATNASVIIDEFSDFQCPFCQQLAPTMRAVRELENVRVVYKQFPLRTIHQYAQAAAEASECAREQNRFWAYHDVLFESKKIDKRSLKLHAQGLGLDMNVWNECMDSGRAKGRVSQDLLEGQQRGVSGTPRVFINGEKFNGRTLADFTAAIQAS